MQYNKQLYTNGHLQISLYICIILHLRELILSQLNIIYSLKTSSDKTNQKTSQACTYNNGHTSIKSNRLPM